MMSNENSMTTADVRRMVMGQAAQYGWPTEIRVQWETQFNVWLESVKQQARKAVIDERRAVQPFSEVAYNVFRGGK